MGLLLASQGATNTATSVLWRQRRPCSSTAAVCLQQQDSSRAPGAVCLLGRDPSTNSSLVLLASAVLADQVCGASFVQLSGVCAACLLHQLLQDCPLPGTEVGGTNFQPNQSTQLVGPHINLKKTCIVLSGTQSAEYCCVGAEACMMLG